MALDMDRLNSKLDFQNQDYWLHIQADTKLDKYPGKPDHNCNSSCQRSDEVKPSNMLARLLRNLAFRTGC